VPVVEEYWAGVVQRLQAEVEVFARLVRHEGEKGRENEAALARLLEAFVPRRLGVGTGMIIDRFDRYARQGDILLFEQNDEPTVLAQTTQLIFPVESVRASVEVKTRLYSDSIDDCQKKKAALQQLQPALKNPDGSSHPLFIVLAYDTGISPETVHRRFARMPRDERPDLYCVLDQGLIGGRGDILRGCPGAFGSGLTLLRQVVDDRRVGEPEPVPQGDATEMVLIGGRSYPLLVMDRGRRSYVAEPARALLLFVEALARSLALQQGRPQPAMSHYLDDAATELLWFENDDEEDDDDDTDDDDYEDTDYEDYDDD
jgi:hypothetical protein